MQHYNRTGYGELRPTRTDFEIWQQAKSLIKQAVRAKKIQPSYDDINFDRKRRASGDAVHHEIYDIHPDPLRVLLCIREAEGTKYGVRTVSKNYYLIKRYGRGVNVSPTSKSKSAKAAKSAQCELGCAINVVEGKTKLTSNRACLNGIAYKQLAIGDDGRLHSVYDGSEWILGQTRSERAMRNHNGGLYVYEDITQARHAPFPQSSILADADKVIAKMTVAGNYCRYGNKLAFSHATPINICEICH